MKGRAECLISDAGVSDLEEAKSLALQAVEANPKDTEAQLALGHLFVRLGRKDEAVAVLETALTLRFDGDDDDDPPPAGPAAQQMKRK